MTISGGIKFFTKSRCDIDNEQCLISVYTGSTTKNNIRDRKNTTKWSSSGSNDSVTETITVDFGANYTIDRLLLVKNNFKAFTVQYWNGTSWTHFAAVVTKEGTKTNITETVNAKETNYYEFTAVSTQKILISVTTTQVAAQEKYVYQVIATQELGTFASYPDHAKNFSKIGPKKTTLSGKSKFSILGELYSSVLTFTGYPTSLDHALSLTLWEGQTPFLIYPCGGDESQFRFQTKSDRLEDIYLVWFDDKWSPNYTQNVYQLPLNYSLSLTEAS
jgi:hypothetical protein